MNGTTATHNESNVSIFILMLLLNFITGLDYANIIEHSAKAFVTALIWLIFKIIADYISERSKRRKE